MDPNSGRAEVKANVAYYRHALYEKFQHDAADSDDDSLQETLGNEVSGSDIPSAAYEYTALSGIDRIRLLRLQPGKGREPVQCTLHEAELATCTGQYEALSYVWGLQEDLTPIQVDEFSLKIGPNLLRALLDMRHEDRERVLWVDAICINQSDVQEKNTQVPLMRDIYTRAMHTLCYVGPKTRKETRQLYAMLNDLAQEAKTLQAGKQTAAHDDAETVPAFISHVPITPTRGSMATKYLGDATIVALANCQWWHRAWTVQELMLSKSPIMMTGRYAISWDDLRAAVDHGFNLQIWAPVHYGFIMDEVIVPYLSVRALDNQRRQRNQKGQVDSSTRDLLNILMQCRHRDSQNPRDKIYAFLGLLRNSQVAEGADSNHISSQLSIDVDYDLPIVHIYRLVSQVFIEKLQNLDILGVCPVSKIRGKPSWVTDWSVTKHLAAPLLRDSLDRQRTTHAARHTQAGCRFPPDGETIVLSGHVLSTVTKLSGALPHVRINSDQEHIQQSAQAIYLASRSQEHIPEQPDPVPDPKPITKTVSEPVKQSKMQGWMDRVGKVSTEITATSKNVYSVVSGTASTLKTMGRRKAAEIVSVFTELMAWENFAANGPPSESTDRHTTDLDSIHYWQTLCAGTYKDGDEQQTKALFQSWSASLQPVRDYVTKHPEYPVERPEMVFGVYWKECWNGYSQFWPYIACAKQRRLGWAADARLCLLPAEAEVGDLIILACGGRVPLVVRADGDGYHEFVGEAYIHGVMDGEAFEEDKCHDIKIC